MIQRSTRSFQRNLKPTATPPRSFSPVVALNEPVTLQASAAEARQGHGVERERIRAAHGRDEHAAGHRSEHEAEIAGARAHRVGPHELVGRHEVGDRRLRGGQVRRLRDGAQRGQADQHHGGVREHQREVDDRARCVRADHDDAAIEAVAEHAGERGRQAVGADHGEQRRRTPDGRMGPAEDERHERHEGHLAAGHGEHAADREAANCRFVRGRVVHRKTLRTGVYEDAGVAGCLRPVREAQSVLLDRRAGNDRTHRYAGPRGRGSWRRFGRHAHLQASFVAGRAIASHVLQC